VLVVALPLAYLFAHGPVREAWRRAKADERQRDARPDDAPPPERHAERG